MSRSKKEKFYVVWNGHNPGIYKTWEECRRETEGFNGASFKSFPTLTEAKRELMLGDPKERSEEVLAYAERTAGDVPLPPEVMPRSVCVDAACSGNPGKMEYRGVYLWNRKEVFHFGPVWGTNNIGEFLAIVHALALMKKKGAALPVYSDSRNAILWVKKHKCNTKLERNSRTEELYRLIERAEGWLRDNKPDMSQIHKWETSKWGEIPADFGRKH